jgi:hypothetical protein
VNSRRRSALKKRWHESWKVAHQKVTRVGLDRHGGEVAAIDAELAVDCGGILDLASKRARTSLESGAFQG